MQLIVPAMRAHLTTWPQVSAVGPGEESTGPYLPLVFHCTTGFRTQKHTMQEPYSADEVSQPDEREEYLVLFFWCSTTR